MKCYHMTSLDRLDSINKLGLIPRNEKNSKLINDNKVKVFFSEGFEGAIALFVDFDIVYHQIKNGEKILENQKLMHSVIHSKDLEDFLGDGVYLCFDMDNIVNERNFENGCTSKIIAPEKLNVVILKNIITGEIISSRFDIIHYMMAKTEPKNIKYYGAQYPGGPSFEAATNRIQGKVEEYYKNHYDQIMYYNSIEYELKEISLNEFIQNKFLR